MELLHSLRYDIRNIGVKRTNGITLDGLYKHFA
jgi:hypothetical protein